MRSFILVCATLALAATAPFTAQAQRSGTYAVEGTEAGTGAAYTGSLQLTATGPETWRAAWRIGGEVTNGVGILGNGVLSFAYTAQREVGVATFKVQPDGTLVGRWTSGTAGTVGTERWLPR